jgi:bacillolysin
MNIKKAFFIAFSVFVLSASIHTEEITKATETTKYSAKSASLGKICDNNSDAYNTGVFQRADKFKKHRTSNQPSTVATKKQQINHNLLEKDLDNLIKTVAEYRNTTEYSYACNSNSNAKEEQLCLGEIFKRDKKPSSVSPLAESENLKEEYGENVKIKFSEKNGTPIFIDLSESSSQALAKAAKSPASRQESIKTFLNRYKGLFKLDKPEEELKLEKSRTDDLGFTHLRYFQYYKGIRVWGKDISFHYNNSGKLQTINGHYEPTPIEIKEIKYLVSSEQALLIVVDDLKLKDKPLQENNAEKIIYFDQTARPHLAWFIEIVPNLMDDFYYFIDAQDGKIIHKYNNRQTDGATKGSGVDLLGKTRSLDIYQIGATYYMINAAKDMFDSENSDIPNKCVGVVRIGDLQNEELADNSTFYHVTSSNKNQWPANSVSLAYHLSVTYDYYKSVHSRKSLDDEGFNVIGMVNVGEDYNNAFWQPGLKRFFFGNGDGSDCIDFTRSLDIVAHEYGHAVTQFSSNLEYQSQSGALNEAFSDYSGVMTEYYENSNTANWYIGEDVQGPSSDGYAGRDLSNPGNISSWRGPFPARMSDYYDLPVTEDGDYGGVHQNCTIPGHALYLISQKIGREKLEKIIYRTYVNYLNSQSEFIDLRVNAIQAAKELYPDSGSDTKVAEAFDEVEIYDGDPTSPDDPYPSVGGDDYVLMLYAPNGHLLSAKSDIPFDQNSMTLYDSYSSNKPSVTENGALAMYVGTDYNIYMLDIKKNETKQLTTNACWHSVAVSPKGDYLAVVPDPDQEAATIHIGDVINQTWEKKELYLPNTGEGAYTKPDYADILDWSNYGGYLVYDCCYSLKQGSTTTKTWGIYLMQAQSEAIVSVFQPESDVLAVGNPVFSNTRDHVIAFDLIDFTNDKYYLKTYDLFHNEIGTIRQNIGTFGHPSFSPDDNKIVFQDERADTMFLAQINLKSDGLNGDPATYKTWVHPAMMPVWYATGTRESNLSTLVKEGFENQNFPPADWLVYSTVSSRTWKKSNVTNHLFSSIDSESHYSAVCPFSADSSQNEGLFSCDFSLAKGDAQLSFYAGYNASWLEKFSLDLYLMDYDGLSEKLWEAKSDGVTGWDWRNVVIDLSLFSGKSRLFLLWRYQGKDGDTVALDGLELKGVSTKVEDLVASNCPTEFKLWQNYPNPFNPVTTISYDLPAPQRVLIKVYDILGREVATLVDEWKPTGYYRTAFDGGSLPSGIYIYRLTAGDFSQIKKLTLIK